MKRAFCLIVLVLVLAAGCAPGPNPLADSPDEEGEVAGFWTGLWQGLIAPFTFVASLFFSRVHFYEVHNSGLWYNVGYFLGLTTTLGGGGGGAARGRRRH